MRRIARLEKSIDFILDSQRLTSRSPAICPTCSRWRQPSQQRAAFSTSYAGLARQGSGSTPFTERIRRKIWGTDAPPGQEDPYGQAGLIESRWRKGQEASEDEVEVGQDVESTARPTAPTYDGAAKMGQYQQAMTWDDLDQVGGYGGWWKDNWDPEHQFHGFMAPAKLSTPQEITAALHRAVIEVFTLQAAGRPLSSVSNAHDDKVISETDKVAIEPSADGTGATLTYPSESVKEAILQSTVSSPPVAEVVEAEAEAEESQTELSLPASPSAKELQAAIESWGKKWLSISLQNPDIKFHVLKRTAQLTGQRIPDPAIASMTTVKHILRTLITAPKPAKLAETLATDARLASLPNVKVFDRRVTPIDREKTVGRWKVIEKELRRRELPVTGRDDAAAASAAAA
ncbi:MAG: hypothetical protein M1819_003796 [Sarea resinae]|nr:MAG: hypothetical protein M1819_003796 [Sarea resinae]